MTTLLPSLALITFGPGEAALVFGILLLLFGGSKIPQIAKGLGAGIRNFKGEIKPPEDETDPDD